MRVRIMILIIVIALCGVLFLYKDMILDITGFNVPNNDNNIDYNIKDSGISNQVIDTPIATQENKPNPAPKLCDVNNSNNCPVMAQSYIDNGDIIKALGVLIQGCEYKNAESCLKLANLYENDANAIKSNYLYFGYIQKACNLDSIDACYAMGVEYYRGNDILNKDIKKSFDLFKKACDNGNMKGCNNLAVIYNNGDSGIKKDIKLAKELFDKACKSGYQPSCDNIKKVFN